MKTSKSSCVPLPTLTQTQIPTYEQRKNAERRKRLSVRFNLTEHMEFYDSKLPDVNKTQERTFEKRPLKREQARFDLRKVVANFFQKP